ncbi:hypothetical protein SAY86_014852 [Trapa natans]|uniref:DUF4378 domain-containing protein n=1 Tax=Trapa natans TaxID=22666 RepID=A0AAN7QGD6_TRANT|nr:hypothetical protein SAY86_014852 [Trapa natans]
MKKHSRNKSSAIHLENHHQGCVWGILHTLNRYQWLNVKKRLPYRRQGRGRNPTGDSGIDGHAQVSDPLQEEDDSQDEKSSVKQKKPGSLSMSKSSVKARLKALIPEERSKRKGQHGRSSTSPAHLKSVPIKPCEKESDDPISLDDETSSDRSSSASPTFKGSEEHWEGSSQQKQFRRAFSADWSVHEAEFLGALGLVNINDELLQKIMHDKRSFLLQRLYSKKQTGTKTRLRRSRTFPSQSSSAAPDPSKEKPRWSTSKAVDLEEARNHEEGDANPEVTFTPVPLPQLKDPQSENSTAIRRFRDIKHKIKHVTRTNRKEKQRIMMDGVIDKIPNDQRVSKEKKEELMAKWRECTFNKDFRRSSHRSEENYKNRKRHFKRTSSLDGGSMDKYCQLFEMSFRKETKHHIPDRLKVRESEEAGLKVGRGKRSLGRILSLPDMKSGSFQTADSGSETISLEHGAFKRGSSFHGTNCLDSQNQLQLDAVLEYDQAEEKPAEDTESAAVEESGLAEASLHSTCLELEGEIFQVEKSSSIGAVESSHVSGFDGNSQEIMPSHESLSVSQDPTPDDLKGPEETFHLEESELQEGETPPDDLQEFQLGAEDAELFKFVKEILEVSGLTGTEAMEAWNSHKQPVSLSVYEEVEGCLLTEPEDAGDDDHLLLFDVINEVLVEMYQQSLSYWPVPLSRNSRIRRMPVGQHLLKEVWASVRTYLGMGPVLDPTLDYVISKDLEKQSGWMDLQFESECTGIELEEMIFDDLLDELI